MTTLCRTLDPPSARAMVGRMLRLALAGDLMLARGVDRIQRTSAPSELREPVVTHAERHVELAERKTGPIPRRVPPEYVWGDARELLDCRDVDLCVVNLETSITAGGEFAREKSIHYRMHPDNIAILPAGRVDCVGLANNHVLDFGPMGLSHTLGHLTGAGIAASGAGPDLRTAMLPATVGGACTVVSIVLPDAGAPEAWRATETSPGGGTSGVYWAPRPEALPAAVRASLEVGAVAPMRKDRSMPIVLSVHWGSNWGYDIPWAHRNAAKALVEEGLVDLIFDHSSHHAKGVEVIDGVPVIYGAGDLINDYEGIVGHEQYRPDIVLLYVAEFEGCRVERLAVVPFCIERFRLRRLPEGQVDDFLIRALGGRTSTAIRLRQGSGGEPLGLAARACCKHSADGSVGQKAPGLLSRPLPPPLPVPNISGRARGSPRWPARVPIRKS